MPVKKILMIVQSTYPNDSRVRREAESLLDEHYEIHIICLRNKNQIESELIKERIYVYRILEKENDESILKYIRFSSRFLLKSLAIARDLSKKNHFSIVQVHNLPDYLVFAALPFKFKETPIILDLHDLTPELFISKWRGEKKFIHWIIKITEYISCKFADHIITTSTGFKERLIQRNVPQHKITIIVNNPSNFVSRTQPLNFRRIDQDLNLIYHGTIAHRFGLHLVLEALPKILEEIPGTVFHIYGGGDDDYKNYLREYSIKLGVENQFKIFNSLLHEEILNIVQKYDIGVVPYLNDEFMQLALSTKAFEYAKLSIPMVASDLRPMRNYFDDDSVLFFEPNNSDNLAEKIIQLAKNKELQEIITRNAQQRILSLIDGSNENKYRELINSLLNKKYRPQNE